MEITKQGDSLSWHFIRFRLTRLDDGGVQSYLDLMLADQVLAPVIDRYGDMVPLWRFHRRWSDDTTGHQFSFIYYAPADVADLITAQIRQNPILEKLQHSGHLRDYYVAVDSPGDVADSSDRSWPETIRREWPIFIMGASRMWLGLLQTESAVRESTELHERYRRTEKKIDALWFDEGSHAFFHHLSALFGYKPLRVIRSDVMTF